MIFLPSRIQLTLTGSSGADIWVEAPEAAQHPDSRNVYSHDPLQHPGGCHQLHAGVDSSTFLSICMDFVLFPMQTCSVVAQDEILSHCQRKKSGRPLQTLIPQKKGKCN